MANLEIALALVSVLAPLWARAAIARHLDVQGDFMMEGVHVGVALCT